MALKEKYRSVDDINIHISNKKEMRVAFFCPEIAAGVFGPLKFPLLMPANFRGQPDVGNSDGERRGGGAKECLPIQEGTDSNSHFTVVVRSSMSKGRGCSPYLLRIRNRQKVHSESLFWNLVGY